ncbi:MAG: AAA family ATPase [Tepidisphaeraceae bacterium]
MAQMFPSVLPEDVLRDPRRRAERDFFELCRNALPAQVVVIYGYRWLDPLDRGRAIEGEADFAIIDPRRGILVLELKGGVIRRDAATGKYFSREVRGTREHEIKDPGWQAANSRRAIVNKVEATKPWRTWRQRERERARAPFPAGFGVVFPDCTAEGHVIAGDITPQNLVDATHLESLDKRLDEVFKTLVGKNPCLPLAKEAMGALLDVLAYDGTLRRPLAVQMADEDRQLLRATNSQLVILGVLRLHARVLLRGGAGTGKTILAIEKARRSAAQGRPTLFLCYNELLGEFLKTSEAAKAGAHVMTFHSLCRQISGLRLAPSGPDDDVARRRYFDEELPAAAYERLIEEDPAQRYQTVVIDEAQDFLPTWYDIIGHLLEPDAAGEPPEYFIALDEDQLPPGRLHRLPDQLSPFPLDENLRNTRCIFTATTPLRRGGPLSCAGPDGEPPRKVRCQTAEELEAAVGKELDHYIESGRVKPEDIVVLVGTSLARSRLALSGRAGRYRLAQVAGGPTTIQIESVWRYKGLEKCVVILAEVDDIASNRQSLYVGATRAKLRLSIIGTTQLLQQFA